MELKYKKLADNAVAPVKMHDSDAGFDLTVSSITTELGEDGQLIIVFHSGISIELPKNYVGFVYPRSSICKKSVSFANGVGVIDSGYRGEIIAKCKTNTNVVPIVYKEGERFAQLIITTLPNITMNESDQLADSDRGTDGFGSTDKQKNTTSTTKK
jgi:dUTP pyrophosphatase